MSNETSYEPGHVPFIQRGNLRGEYRQNGEPGRKGLLFALIVFAPSLILLIFTIHMNQTTRNFLWGYSWLLYVTAVSGFITAACFAYFNLEKAFNSHNYRTLQIYDAGFQLSDDFGWQSWYEWDQITDYTNASVSKIDRAADNSQRGASLNDLPNEPVGCLFGLAFMPVIWAFSLVWKWLYPLDINYQLKLETTDGMSFEFNNDYNQIEELELNLEAVLLPALTVRLKIQLNEGQTVKVSGVELTKVGLSYEGKTCPWDQISSVYLREDEIVIKTRQASNSNHFSYSSNDFVAVSVTQPNALVLRKLVSELGSQIQSGLSW